MKNFDIKKVLNWLGFMLKCPVCSAKYYNSNIKIIDSEQLDNFSEAHLLIHSDCHKCKSSVMFNIDISGQDVFTVIAKTDLTKKDSSKFSKLPAIDVDDLIDMHQSIDAFDGNFIDALNK
ncbi:MAG: hypothetical protein R3B41_01755 [Candidatus Doudnabacteria bacterium]